MISIGNLISNKFAIGITGLSLYFVSVTASRIKIIYFYIYNDVDFLKDTYDLFDIQRDCSMLFI